MSSAYSSQPATNGKVVLNTSAGELEIELWPKESPKACRNFVQLCMEGYYDNSPIHRIVPNFIVQAGDPTGTGEGGESIYGQPFDNEYHSRLRFTHRGILAMANTGPHSNQSQFFITLAPALELNGKNTIFGKVVGDTIFNLLKLGELEIKNERPLFDARIISASIIFNPFEDIIPRTTAKERAETERLEHLKSLDRERRDKPKGIMNKSLLSFTTEECVKTTEHKSKSMHDAILDTKLSRDTIILKGSSFDDINSLQKRKLETDNEDFDKKTKSRIEAQKKVDTSNSAVMTKPESIQDKIKKLQSEIKQIGLPKKIAEKPVVVDDSSLAKMREEFLSSGKATESYHKSNKGDLESRLASFQKSLCDVDKSCKVNRLPIKKAKNEGGECSLHYLNNCASCRDTFGENLSEDDSDWMNSTLKFEKTVGANVYEPKIDDYTVIDPRKGVKADPFGRDIQVLGDIKGRQKTIWSEKSTRTIKSLTEQYLEQPDFVRE